MRSPLWRRRYPTSARVLSTAQPSAPPEMDHLCSNRLGQITNCSCRVACRPAGPSSSVPQSEPVSGKVLASKAGQVFARAEGTYRGSLSVTIIPDFTPHETRLQNHLPQRQTDRRRRPPQQLRDFTIRMEILWESETSTNAELTPKEVEFMQRLPSNNPRAGYNRRPKHEPEARSWRADCTDSLSIDIPNAKAWRRCARLPPPSTGRFPDATDKSIRMYNFQASSSLCQRPKEHRPPYRPR